MTLLIALAASIPLAALGWVAGQITERAGAGPRLRSLVWTTALVLPMVLAPAALMVEAANLHSPLAVVRPLVSPPQAPMAAPSVMERSSPAQILAAPEPATSRGGGGPRTAISWPALTLMILIVGAAAFGTVLLRRVRLLARLLARSCPCEEDALLDLLAQQARRLGVSAPALRIDPDGGAPLLTGILRPAILLPAGLLSVLHPERIALICAHELAHLKRRDNLTVIVESILIALFWFNPVLRANQARLAGAREEICDAMALAAAERQVRRAYADSLFSALSLAARPAPALAFTGQGADMVRRRLLAILRPAAAPALAIPAALTLGATLLACGAIASVALAASPPVRAAAAAAVSKAASQVTDLKYPASSSQKAQIQRPLKSAASPHIRLEIRVLSAPERLLADVLAQPRGDGYAFALEPTLRSTYEDGPVVTVHASDDLDALLARFSRNEMTWRKLEPIDLVSGAQTSSLDRSSGLGLRSPPNIPILSSGSTVGGDLEFISADYVYGTPSSNFKFNLTLQPTLRPGGRIALTAHVLTEFGEYPLTRVVDGPGPDGRYLKTIGFKDGVRTDRTVHIEATGEMSPVVRRERTSTIEMTSGQVLAIGGISTDRNYLAPRAPSPTGGTPITFVVLIRPVLEPAG